MQREWELNSSFEAQAWSPSRGASKELDVPIVEAVSARNRYLNAYFGLNQVLGRKRKDSLNYHEYF